MLGAGVELRPVQCGVEGCHVEGSGVWAAYQG